MCRDYYNEIIRIPYINIRFPISISLLCSLNETGDIIPADGILLECNELKIDESTMTGESDLVTKQLDRNIILYAGKKFYDLN